MTTRVIMALLALCLHIASAGSETIANELRPASTTHGVIGKDQVWQTSWWIVDSGRIGPTVLVVGGVHGNEPAGFRAAEQIRHWPIERGRLIVIPQVNRMGLRANSRWAPQHRNSRKLRDLNRNFPRAEQPAQAASPLCLELWAFIKRCEPNWVFDLHEGFDVHRRNPKSVGSSVIAFPEQADLAAKLVNAVNQDIHPEYRFEVLSASGPVVGSLARACAEQLGAKSFILETTFKSQPISKRTRQHRRMMSQALNSVGMISRPYDQILAPRRASNELTRIAIFDDAGANPTKVVRALEADQANYVVHVGPLELNSTALDQFDVIVFPGGSGSKQGRAIGKQGRERVRKFAEDGGGVIGICAGAYLCSAHYDWSLHLINAAVFNESFEIPGKGRKSMWYRGPAANVQVGFTAEGARLFEVDGVQMIRYQNGPIFSPGRNDQLPAYRVLATFRSENGIYEQQKNTMIGAPAAVDAQYGSGRILAISPHFESTKGQEAALLKAIGHVRPTQRQ